MKSRKPSSTVKGQMNVLVTSTNLSGVQRAAGEDRGYYVENMAIGAFPQTALSFANGETISPAQTSFQLVRRFIYCRWSAVRREIHSLPIGGEVSLPLRKWNSIVTSISRLEEAYEHTRRYHVRSGKRAVTVTRSL